MSFVIGINSHLVAAPAFRTAWVAGAAPGETAYTAIPEGRRRASAAARQSDDELGVGERPVGPILHVRPAAQQGFHGGNSVTLVMSGREGRHSRCS